MATFTVSVLIKVQVQASDEDAARDMVADMSYVVLGQHVIEEYVDDVEEG